MFLTSPHCCEGEVSLRPPSQLHQLLPLAQSLGTSKRAVVHCHQQPEVMARLNPRMLFICLPDTAETEGLVGDREISLLPEGAVIVNVGRALLAARRQRARTEDLLFGFWS